MRELGASLARAGVRAGRLLSWGCGAVRGDPDQLGSVRAAATPAPAGAARTGVARAPALHLLARSLASERAGSAKASLVSAPVGRLSAASLDAVEHEQDAPARCDHADRPTAARSRRSRSPHASRRSASARAVGPGRGACVLDRRFVAGEHDRVRPRVLLLDIDGVLYVEDEPVLGAVAAVRRLRAAGRTLRFVTNTTSRSRAATLAKLSRLGFTVAETSWSRRRRWRCGSAANVAFGASRCSCRTTSRLDFAGLEQGQRRLRADAVIVGDLGEAWDYAALNAAFRLVMDGADLIALQKNRFWLRADGLSLDVGPFVAALEYATGPEATVVGKPASGVLRAGARRCRRDGRRRGDGRRRRRVRRRWGAQRGPRRDPGAHRQVPRGRS